jgi:hypothetical protein
MRAAVRRSARFLALAFFVPALLASPPVPNPLDDFVCRLQKNLQERDLAAYLALFSPALRAGEAAALDDHFNAAGLATAKSRRAGVADADSAEPRVVLQVLFENDHAALVESWQLRLGRSGEGWTVRNKTVAGTISNLHKLRIPETPGTRASRVEIVHTDFRLTFENAAVFADNLPDVETALVVVGRGRVRFEPSNAEERHQLELLYKQPVFEDAVESVYLRAANDFFPRLVRIEPAGPGAPPVTPLETATAAALFGNVYARSFTIETPFARQPLSFLPQGEETVVDFRTKRSGEMTYIFSPFTEEEVSLFDRSRDRLVSLYSPEDAETPGLRRMYMSLGERFDVRHYDVEVGYDPESRDLSGKARIEILSRSETLDHLKFRFASELEILKVVDDEKRELFFTRDKLRKIVYIYLLSPFRRGESGGLEVFYRGRIVPPIPTTDVALGGGQDRFVFRPRYLTTLFTQSADWYPAPTTDDYFTARLKVLVPPEYQCVAGGELVERGRFGGAADVAEIEKLGNPYFIFEFRRPVKYLAFLAGQLDRLNVSGGAVPIETFAATDLRMQRWDFTADARRVLDFFVKLFGPFPYEKLTVIQRLWPASGGHSPAGFVVLNEQPWIGDRPFPANLSSPVDLSSYEGYFLAHEIAHQWWGQGVSWTSYRDQWLSEGLSQFAAALYIREAHGERAFAAVLKKFAMWTERKSARGPISLGSRLSYTDFDAFQAIVYDKASLALFMLKEILGEEAFFAGLRDFFAAHRFGPARTSDFVKAMEKASGRELSSFFAGWFFAHELPRVRVTAEPAREDGADRLRVRVVQLNGPFVFPLSLTWLENGRPARGVIIVEERDREFLLPAAARPENIRVNPDRSVPGRFD